jgi:hypothetical protein
MSRSWWKIGITVVVVILILAGVFIFSSVHLAHTPNPPRLSVALVSYITNNSGVRCAQFAVTNLDARTAVIYYPYIITNETVSTFGGYRLPSASFNAVLDSGASKVFVFAAPTNQVRWKLRFSCDPSSEAQRKIRGVWTRFVNITRAGAPVRVMRYEIKSAWITNEDVAGTNNSK